MKHKTFSDADSVTCSEHDRLYLGIDGGSSKTVFALANKEGKLLRRIEKSSSNPFDRGFGGAADVLKSGIDEVTDGFRLKNISAFAGLSGGGNPVFHKKFTELLSDYGFAHVSCGTDVDNLLAAGLGKNDGIAVIMGTGISVFTKIDTVIRQIGGLGYLFDRGGSGYAIGTDAIRCACMAEDGSGEATLLTEYFCSHFHTATVRENLRTFYGFTRADIAAFAPAVFECYRCGDPVSKKIIRDNMRYASMLINVGLRHHSKSDSTVPVIISGGLTHESNILFPMIRDTLVPSPNCEISAYTGDIVFGALLNAGLSGVSALDFILLNNTGDII